MPIPPVTPLPTAPQRTDDPDTFILRADAFVAAMQGLPDEINDANDYIASLAASLGVSSADDQLLALSSLSPASGDIPYFTASNTAALIASTAFGRALAALADAAALRTAAALGTIATQSAASVAITGGTVAGITDLAIADGGTGASSASAARTNLDVPSNAEMDSAIVAAMPAGAIQEFAMSTPPSGFLECDGSAVSRTTYASLFAAVGTTWGTGDGSTTFTLPDFRGEFRRGWDHGRGVDSGRAFASYQADDLASHTHTLKLFSDTQISHDASSEGDRTVDSSGTATSNFIGSTGGTETRPRNYAVLVCIKT